MCHSLHFVTNHVPLCEYDYRQRNAAVVAARSAVGPDDSLIADDLEGPVLGQFGKVALRVTQFESGQRFEWMLICSTSLPRSKAFPIQFAPDAPAVPGSCQPSTRQL